MTPHAIVKRERSSDGTCSVDDPAVVTAPEQSASEAADSKGERTKSEPPVRSSVTSTDDQKAPVEAPTTITSTTEVVNGSAGTTAQTAQAQERDPELSEGTNSDAKDTGQGEEMGGHKDETSKEEDEEELRLPLVATDITFVTFRSGEKVTGNACFALLRRRSIETLTCRRLSYSRQTVQTSWETGVLQLV